MQLPRRGGSRISYHHAIKPPIIGFSHRARHAYIGRDARDDQIPYSPQSKDVLEVSVREGASAGLVGYDVCFLRVEFVNDVAPGLASHEEAAEGAGVADAFAGGVVAGAEELAAGEGGEVGRVGLHGLSER